MIGHFLKLASRSFSRLKNQRKPLNQAPDIQGKSFLFIGGLHRSGTSIIHRLLSEHPLTSGFSNTGVPEDEGQHLQSVFKTAHEYGGPGEFAFHPEAHLIEDSILINSDNRGRLLAEWGAYFDLEKSLLLEKSPPNLIRSRCLRQMLPNSKFLFMVRHPAAVSLATEKWSSKSIVEQLQHWNTAYSIMLDDIAAADDCLVIRYEDFVRAPTEQLDQVCDFAGIHRFSAREAVEDYNEKYFQRWQTEYDSESESLQAVFSSNSNVLEHFGYSLTKPFVNQI